jgi:hypothetical protein
MSAVIPVWVITIGLIIAFVGVILVGLVVFLAVRYRKH